MELVTVSAEDRIVSKAFAGSLQDWDDFRGIVICQSVHLEWQLILGEVTPLCELKESPESVDRLIDMRNRLNAE